MLVAPSAECLRGKSPPDRMLAIPWRRLFLAAYGLNLVVVAVLRDGRVIGCCPAWPIAVKVERSVLTTINEDVMLYTHMVSQCKMVSGYRNGDRHRHCWLVWLEIE